MSPMDFTPKYTQPPDPRRHSQPPKEPPVQQTCQRKGCGGKINPKTGTCLICGHLHGKSTPRYAQQTPEKPVTPGRPTSPLPTTSGAKAFPDKMPRQSGSEPHTIMPRSPILDDIGRHEPRASKRSQSKTTYSEPREWRIPPIGRYLRPVLAGLLVLSLLVGIVAGIGTLISYFLNRSESTTTTSSPTTPAYSLAVNVEHPERGTVSREPNDTDYKSGTVVKLTAVPGSGYVFDKWSGDIAGSSSEITITIDSNKDVMAHFKVIDKTPPTISEVKIVKYSDRSATITWNTDEPAFGQIRYKHGGMEDYANVTESELIVSLQHSVKLTGLRANTTYYLLVESRDNDGNLSKPTMLEMSTFPAIREGHEVGKLAPNLNLRPYEYCDKLPTSSGALELSSFLGKKKTYINFWSTYCMPCVVEFPLLQTIYADLIDPEEWVIITICIDGREDRIAKLWEKYPELKSITLPILFYAEGADKDAYNIWKLPTSVFIDEDGIIRHVKLGRFYNVQEVVDVLDSI